MNTIVIRALAKINLAIDVLDKRENGYHDIDMVTVPLKLHDSVEITPLGRAGDTYLYCDDPTIVCDESNLAYKAFDAMKSNFSHNGQYRIIIHKRIPVEAGLGGGSADAAAVIKAIDTQVKDDGNKDKREAELALKIGSDVPFCLYDKPSRVRGIGEILEPIKVKYPYQVLIVKPNVGLSTKSVYEAYDLVKDEVTHPDIPALIKALEEDDEEGIRKNMINVLSYPAKKALPLIDGILNKMHDMGLTLYGMSGTGSACYALSKDKKKLERISHNFEKEGYSVYLTEFAL
jgi:4-diphosphocytidyl-2-C-methyl-D-erythritol kinase